MWRASSGSVESIFAFRYWAWTSATTSPSEVETAAGWWAAVIVPRSNSKSTCSSSPAAQRYWS